MRSGSALIFRTASASRFDLSRNGSLSRSAFCRMRGSESLSACSTSAASKLPNACSNQSACTRASGEVPVAAIVLRSGITERSCRSNRRRWAVVRCQPLALASCFTNSAELNSAEVRFEIALTQRMVGHDPIDPPHRVAIIEIDLLANLLRNGLRRLDHLAIDVGDVEIAVGGVGEIAWPEPHVRGSQKLYILFPAVSQESGAILAKNVAVDQIAADVAGEDVAGIFFRKCIARVDRAA